MTAGWRECADPVELAAAVAAGVEVQCVAVDGRTWETGCEDSESFRRCMANGCRYRVPPSWSWSYEAAAPDDLVSRARRHADTHPESRELIEELVADLSAVSAIGADLMRREAPTPPDGDDLAAWTTDQLRDLWLNITPGSSPERVAAALWTADRIDWLEDELHRTSSAHEAALLRLRAAEVARDDWKRWAGDLAKTTANDDIARLVEQVDRITDACSRMLGCEPADIDGDAADAVERCADLHGQDRWEDDCHGCGFRVGDHTTDGRCPTPPPVPPWPGDENDDTARLSPDQGDRIVNACCRMLGCEPADIDGDAALEEILTDAVERCADLHGQDRWEDDCHGCGFRVGDHTTDGRCPAPAAPVPPWPGAVLSGLCDEDGQPTWLAQAGQVRGEQVRCSRNLSWTRTWGYGPGMWVEVRAPRAPETERVQAWEAVRDGRQVVGASSPFEAHYIWRSGPNRASIGERTMDKAVLVAPDGTVEVLRRDGES